MIGFSLLMKIQITALYQQGQFFVVKFEISSKYYY